MTDQLLKNTSFSCEKCNKTFANKANLKRHYETHGERKECEQCGATFSCKDTLKKHIKSRHGETTGSAPQIQNTPNASQSIVVGQILTSPRKPGGVCAGTMQTGTSSSTTGTAATASGQCFTTQFQQAPSIASPPQRKSVPQAANASSSPKKEKSHICSVCERGYTSRGGLIKHIAEMHPDKASELIKIASETNQPVVSTRKGSCLSNKHVTHKQVRKTFACPKPLSADNAEKNHILKVGDRILTPKSRNGTLRYKGDVDFAPGVWAGVELDTPTGQNDGSTKHKRYFQCPPKHGLFVLLAKITKLPVSTMTTDTTDSGYLRGPSPGNTFPPSRTEFGGPSSSSILSGVTLQTDGNSHNISQKATESPNQAKKRCPPLRCNNCEGCERNQKREDCGECSFCKDKKKFGGPDTIRKPCEKKKCTVPVRRSLAEDDDASHSLKRKLPVNDSEEQAVVLSLGMKKKKTNDDMNGTDKYTLKLEKEQAEKKFKQAEKEKTRLEKKLIHARASANAAKTERDIKENENKNIMKEHTILKQELQRLRELGNREAERKFEVEKEKYEKQLRTLESEKAVIYKEMKSTKDQNHAVEKELAQLKNEKDKIEEKLDQAKKAMLQQLQSLKNNNEKISKEKSEIEKKYTLLSMENDVIKMERDRIQRQLAVGQENSTLNAQLQSLREENERLKQRIATSGVEPARSSEESAPAMEVPSVSSSGTYCDICDVTDHDTEDCPEQMYESLSQDTEAQTEQTTVSSIPEPVIAPVLVPLVRIDNLPSVYFDLETTGLGRHSHITQIAARNTAGNSFDRYVIPKIPINPGAATATRNKIINGQFYHKDRPVLAITVSQALREFFYFIGDSPVLLIGHNIKTFDCHVLLNAVKSCGMLGMLEIKVAGFLDTLYLIRSSTTPPYKQEKLYERLVGGTYDAHNALEDVKALQKLIDKINPSSEERRKYTFSIQYVLDVQKYKKDAANNRAGWKTLIERGVITSNMAEKAAKSGLRPEHLEFSFENGREDAVYHVLSQPTLSGLRVTNNKEISKRLSDYCKNKLLGLF